MKEGEAHGLRVHLGDQRLGGGLASEERLVEHLDGAGDLLGRALVLGQLAHEAIDLLDVSRGGRANRDAHASLGGSISRLRILPVGPLGSSSTNHTLRGYL